jgi:hypothetical protein
MHLRRITPNVFDKRLGALEFSSDQFKSTAYLADSETQTYVDAVAVRFPRFGEGARRQSDFEVCAEWKDVQRMIDIFCESGEPEAIAIRDAMKLAAAVQAAGWQPLQSN